MRANKITNNGEVLLDLTQDTATPETVGEGVTFHTADGSPAVGTAKLGGAELNIAYGDVPPEDTTKLWVKTTEPKGITVKQAERIVDVSIMPYPYTCVSCIAVDKIIYLISPKKSTMTVSDKLILSYDTETEICTTLNIQLPQSLYMASCAEYDGKVYIFGGSNNGSGGTTIICWDIATGTLTTLSSTFGNPVNHSACATIGSKAYIFGGEGSNYNTTYNAIYRFDMDTETLTKISATIGYGKSTGAGCVVYEGKIYVFGGRGSSNAFGSVWCFDPETETGSGKAQLDTMIYGMSYGCIGSKLYIFYGGIWRYSSHIPFTNVIEYDLSSSDTYGAAKELAFTTRGGVDVGCCTIGDTIYLFGGLDKRGVMQSDTDIVSKFSPNVRVDKDHLAVECMADRQPVNLFETETVKVTQGVYDVLKGNAEGIGEPVEAALYKDGAWTNI